MRIELFVTDPEVSVDFLVRVLGFTVVSADAATGYTALDLEGSRVAVQRRSSLPADHPLARPGAPGLGVEIVLPLADVDAKYAVARASGAAVSDLVVQPWGLTDFRVQDPDGYYFRLTSP